MAESLRMPKARKPEEEGARGEDSKILLNSLKFFKFFGIFSEFFGAPPHLKKKKKFLKSAGGFPNRRPNRRPSGTAKRRGQPNRAGQAGRWRAQARAAGGPSAGSGRAQREPQAGPARAAGAPARFCAAAGGGGGGRLVRPPTRSRAPILDPNVKSRHIYFWTLGALTSKNRGATDTSSKNNLDRARISRKNSSWKLQKLIRRPFKLRFQQAYSRTERLGNTNPTKPNSTQSEPKRVQIKDSISTVHPDHSVFAPDPLHIYELCHSRKTINSPSFLLRGDPSQEEKKRRRREEKPRREQLLLDHRQNTAGTPPKHHQAPEGRRSSARHGSNVGILPDAGILPNARVTPDFFPSDAGILPDTQLDLEFIRSHQNARSTWLNRTLHLVYFPPKKNLVSIAIRYSTSRTDSPNIFIIRWILYLYQRLLSSKFIPNDDKADQFFGSMRVDVLNLTYVKEDRDRSKKILLESIRNDIFLLNLNENLIFNIT
ncbi:hypothetical protein IEQ34_003792 [Dendrobium chrysotoxum]|uniref:Uncharacterized protein n=1 Tax=Dendrobium chrysotoxum TaxID=161865 RepID=A0AAV7HEN5_DENCH|nr:hypothetical protein IEQ34_003792 [Dendrobium chrysotoxum]